MCCGRPYKWLTCLGSPRERKTQKTIPLLQGPLAHANSFFLFNLHDRFIHSNITVTEIGSYSDGANKACKLQRRKVLKVGDSLGASVPFKGPRDAISGVSCIPRKPFGIPFFPPVEDPTNQLLRVVALLMPKVAPITTPTYPCGGMPGN